MGRGRYALKSHRPGANDDGAIAVKNQEIINLILLSTFCAEPPDARDSVARDIDCDGTQEGSMLPSLVASINHKSGYDGVGCIDVRFVDSHTAPYDQQSLKHIIDFKH